jgi:transposase
VDWGDKKHTFEVRGGDGRVWSGEIAQQPEAIHDWVAQLRRTYPTGTIGVATEQSRGTLIYALSRYDFIELLPVHPARTAAYRRFVRPSGAKNDSMDAALICEYVQKHGQDIRPWHPADPITRELLLLVEWRRKLVEQRVASCHQVCDTLKQYFPQALDWIGEISSRMALDFLARWPTLETIRRCKPSTVRSFYTHHGSRSSERINNRLAQIASATPLHGDQALVSALSTIVAALVPIIRTLSEQIQYMDDRIAALWSSHPDRQIFDSFPGAGTVLAPRLAVALGTDRSRWTANSLQAFSGIAPLLVQSGSSRWVHSRWNCPKFLRQTFHEFAEYSIPKSRWAGAFYRQQRARGISHHAAIRALAFRWIRVIVRCWKDGKPYDDSHYTKRLIEAGSPLAPALAA